MNDIEKIKAFLAEGLRIADKATPGPWHFDCGNGDVESHAEEHWRATVAIREDICDRHDHYSDFNLKVSPKHPNEDMEFIADARARVEKLSRALDFAVSSLSLLFMDEVLAAVAKEIES